MLRLREGEREREERERERERSDAFHKKNQFFSFSFFCPPPTTTTDSRRSFFQIFQRLEILCTCKNNTPEFFSFYRIIRSTAAATLSDASAKPTPVADVPAPRPPKPPPPPPPLTVVAIPTRAPEESTAAPPAHPAPAKGASVCKHPVTSGGIAAADEPCGSATALLRPETTPAVAKGAPSPEGAATTKRAWPTFREEEGPKGKGGRRSDGGREGAEGEEAEEEKSTRSRATSDAGSVPITEAPKTKSPGEPSLLRIFTNSGEPAAAASACAAVATTPPGSTATPEQRGLSGFEGPLRAARTLTTEPEAEEMAASASFSSTSGAARDGRGEEEEDARRRSEEEERRRSLRVEEVDGAIDDAPSSSCSRDGEGAALVLSGHRARRQIPL